MSRSWFGCRISPQDIAAGPITIIIVQCAPMALTTSRLHDFRDDFAVLLNGWMKVGRIYKSHHRERPWLWFISGDQYVYSCRTSSPHSTKPRRSLLRTCGRGWNVRGLTRRLSKRCPTARKPPARSARSRRRWPERQDARDFPRLAGPIALLRRSNAGSNVRFHDLRPFQRSSRCCQIGTPRGR